MIIVINIIPEYVQPINYRNVCVQRNDVKWYHYFIVFNGNIPDVVRKRSRILGVVIFIFNIDFQNICYVFVQLYNGEPLHETIVAKGALGLYIFGWS